LRVYSASGGADRRERTLEALNEVCL
jgi:hypothetical protein